jgi:CBS domain-containing protein
VLAETKQGAVPCPYVFLALGSQGRQEMSLFADQDNAILYDPGPDSPALDELSRYFLDLGQQVCSWLDAAGYPFCRGLTMARNPKWCAPLSSWRRVVEDWIRKPEPQQVLESAIFLDFRPVHGREELARALRRHVHETLQANPAFLPFLARDLLGFEPPPSGLSRRLRPWRTEANQLDLKAVLMPLNGMARVYALRHELDETHTIDRLEALAKRALISESNLREIVVAYELLLRLRLIHQAECLREGHPLDNTIDRRRLTRLEQTQLDQAFQRIVAIQKKVSYDFLGGV